jgi:hypothetical protein
MVDENGDIPSELDGVYFSRQEDADMSQTTASDFGTGENNSFEWGDKTGGY